MSDATAAENLRSWMSTCPSSPYAWKVAINFPDGQRRLGLTGALAAPLPERKQFDEEVDVPAGAKLFVEAELAVRVARDLDEDADTPIVEAVAPCLELVDYALPATSLQALLAHSFFHAGIVLGDFVPAAEVGLLQAPYPRARNEQGETHERVAGVVDDDLEKVVRQLAAQARAAGTPLRRGQLVLRGSYIEPLSLRPGSRVEVDYGPAWPTLRVRR